MNDTVKQFYQQNQQFINDCQSIPLYSNAINLLKPDASFIINGDGLNVLWFSENNPTTEQILSTTELLSQYRPWYLLRKLRDQRLTDSDKFMLPDFPITIEQLQAIKTYRQQLRDLPDTLTTTPDIDNLEAIFPAFPL